jgi:hypothetical protein
VRRLNTHSRANIFVTARILRRFTIVVSKLPSEIVRSVETSKQRFPNSQIHCEVNQNRPTAGATNRLLSGILGSILSRQLRFGLRAERRANTSNGRAAQSRSNRTLAFTQWPAREETLAQSIHVQIVKTGECRTPSSVSELGRIFVIGESRVNSSLSRSPG